MPRIPTQQFSTGLRVGGARIDPGAATAVSRAAGQLGQVVASQASQAIKQQRQADDAAFVSEQTNKMLRQESEIFADIETKGTSIELDKQQEQFNERVSVFTENAPSQEAANEIRLQADNVFSRKFFPAYSRHQAGINVNKRVNSFESALDDIQSEVLTGRTDVPEAVARASAAIEGLNAVAGGTVDIDAVRQGAFNSISTNSLTGRINKGEGLQVIAEIKAGQWDQLTDTPTLSRVLALAERDIKQRQGAEKKQFSEGINDYLAFLSSGQDDIDTASRFSPEQVTARFGADEGAKINEQITDARSFGQTMNEIKTASPAEIQSLVEREKPTGPDKFGRESKQFNITLKAIQARNKAIANDPSAYVLTNSQIAQASFNNFTEAFQSGDPETIAESAREYSTIQRSTQEDLGVHPQGVQLLPKQFEDQLAKQLNDFSQGGENVAAQLDSLKTAFGSEWSTVQRQLQQNKKMGGGLRVMSGMDFGPEMIRLGEALSIKQVEYKDVIGNDSFNAIKADTIAELEDFQLTLRGQPGAESAFIQHKVAIESLAMKYMADGTFDDTGDAIEQAKGDVLDSRFTFVDTYRVPANLNADDVEFGVDDFMDRIQDGEFNLRIPDSGVVENLEDRREVYLSALRPKPITEPNGDGILFVDQNGNAIFKENGDPLIVKWKELQDKGAESFFGLF